MLNVYNSALYLFFRRFGVFRRRPHCLLILKRGQIFLRFWNHRFLPVSDSIFKWKVFLLLWFIICLVCIRGCIRSVNLKIHRSIDVWFIIRIIRGFNPCVLGILRSFGCFCCCFICICCFFQKFPLFLWLLFRIACQLGSFQKAAFFHFFCFRRIHEKVIIWKFIIANFFLQSADSFFTPLFSYKLTFSGTFFSISLTFRLPLHIAHMSVFYKITHLYNQPRYKIEQRALCDNDHTYNKCQYNDHISADSSKSRCDRNTDRSSDQTTACFIICA